MQSTLFYMILASNTCKLLNDFLTGSKEINKLFKSQHFILRISIHIRRNNDVNYHHYRATILSKFLVKLLNDFLITININTI